MLCLLNRWMPPSCLRAGLRHTNAPARVQPSLAAAPFSAAHRRWDAWARMMQPLMSRLPLISTRGNHEIEQLLAADNATMVAAAARYPYPQVATPAGGQRAACGLHVQVAGVTAAGSSCIHVLVWVWVRGC